MTYLWKAALDDLASKVSSHNFDSWFRNIACHHVEGQTAFLEVADDFLKAWIEDNYLDLIEDSLTAVNGRKMEAVIQVRGSYDEVEAPAEAPASRQPRSLNAPDDAMAARSGRVREVAERMSGIDAPAASAPVVEAPALVERSELSEISESTADLHAKILAAGMNPRYTFDEYVVGPSNQFVHAACQAVAQNPARSYNPLFIFGGVGLGKTHLLQAIGIEMLRRDPSTRVVNLSSEEFMNQLITSLRQKDMNAFRMQFRNNCDLLLIDDIQFIGGKDSTQEEFFHTFNALYQSGKQIVITSDKSPKELPGIEDRLASRFSWGLIADIQPPEMETRIAILEKKAEADGIELTKDVAMLIASSVRSNVRELEGTLIRLGAQASLMGQPVTTAFAHDMLKRMNIEQGRQLTAERIIDVVAEHFGITASDIKGKRRTRAISEPRQIAMYLARKHTDDSYPELGRKFGGKDHTTVIAAHRKLEDLCEQGSDGLAGSVAELEAILLR